MIPNQNTHSSLYCLSFNMAFSVESRGFDPKLIAFVSFGCGLVGSVWVRVKQWRNRSNWWLRPREILIPASTHKTNATSLHTTAHLSLLIAQNTQLHTYHKQHTYHPLHKTHNTLHKTQHLSYTAQNTLITAHNTYGSA